MSSEEATKTPTFEQITFRNRILCFTKSMFGGR